MEKKRKKTLTNTQTFFKLTSKLNDHNTKRLTLFILILEANLYMYIIWIQPIKIWKLSKMEAWCMVGGLVHGRWVGVWLVAFSQQLLSDFWLQIHHLDGVFWLGCLHQSCSQLSPWKSPIWIMSFGLLELQKCQKHCTYLKLGWKNVFPNSDQLVASLSCLKQHLLTKWSSVKLEIWVLSFQWPSFSPRGGL